MKIYIRRNRITLTGKAWQIKAKLKEYSRNYRFVTEFLAAMKTKR